MKPVTVGLVELELPATFDKVYEQEAYDNEVNPNRGCRNLRDRQTAAVRP
jgi:hypothetical protein